VGEFIKAFIGHVKTDLSISQGTSVRDPATDSREKNSANERTFQIADSELAIMLS